MINESLQQQFTDLAQNDTENKIAEAEITLDDVAEVLSSTIKDDDSNKKIVFLCMLSAYTADGQINVSLNAPSSTGKTYLAKEVAKLFPSEDKIEKSGASPTSFFYGEGEIDAETGAKIISLERKILIFYEMPNPLLQEKLRALMSHDDKNLKYSITNKNKGRNKTDDIILRGYSATIFCSAGLRLDEQEATRAILLSPEATAAKIQQGIQLGVRRAANTAKYNEELKWNYNRQMLMFRIAAIRDAQVEYITVPNESMIEKKFISIVGILKPRHQRDVAHLMQLIKAIALLNVWHRRDSNNDVVATQRDVDEGFKLWEEFFESQNLNISPVVLKMHKKYIVPAYKEKFKNAMHRDRGLWEEMRTSRIGITSQELSVYYLKAEGTALIDEQLRKQILPQLANAGLISWDKPQSDDVDKRARHIIPLVLTDDDKKYIGTYQGDNTELIGKW